MSRIAELGDQILRLQEEIGLENPRNFNPGMSAPELAECPMLMDLPPSELHELYKWRNGTVSNTSIPMGRLWLIPGAYLVSAQDALEMNRSLVADADWSAGWYPLLSSGSSDMHFYDKMKLMDGNVPIFYYDPEYSPGLWKKYDNVEKMFSSILECYEKRAYLVGSNGWLDVDARREVEICKRLNPDSDHWRRRDLFK